jgi:acetyl-CoA carboxylase biotin carboxyl carrier protein
MNPEEMKELKELIEFLKENKIGEFALERGELKVQLKFQPEQPAGSVLDVATIARLLGAQQQPGLQLAPVLAAAVSAPAETPAESAAAAAATASAAEEASYHTVKSPIVGTFYESPSPGASAFVKPGDHVDVGQPLCIVEAMKLMNEIESDVAGEVIRRLVQNGQPVEFGQPLFLVRPS